MEPWHRQKGEKEHEWSFFSTYLKQKVRNKTEVAREYGYSRDRIYRISKLWYWDSRVKAHDNRLQQVEDDVMISGREELARAHLKSLGAVREAGDLAIDLLLDRLRVAVSAEEGLLPRDALNFLKEAVSLERLITGDATERTETREGYDMSKLSAEQAEQMVALLEILQT